MQHAETGRKLDEDDERRREEGLWAFSAPVKLYRTIRLDRRATILTRNLPYSKNPASGQQSGRLLSLRVASSDSVRKSVIVAICKLIDGQDFAPLAAAIVHLTAAPAHPRGMETKETTYGQVASVILQLPAAAQADMVIGNASGTPPELAILIIESGEHQDLWWMRRRSAGRPQVTKPLTVCLHLERAFGLLACGSAVKCCQIPLSPAAVSHHRVQSFQAVLQPFRLHIQERRCWGPNGQPLLSCSFRDGSSGSPQTAGGLIAQVQWVPLSPEAAAAAGNMHSVQQQQEVGVYYCYRYHNDSTRYVVEKRPGNICAFCLMHCTSFEGLQQHLRASHELFTYTFPLSEQPEATRAIHVFCPLHQFTSDYDLRRRQPPQGFTWFSRKYSKQPQVRMTAVVVPPVVDHPPVKMKVEPLPPPSPWGKERPAVREVRPTHVTKPKRRLPSSKRSASAASAQLPLPAALKPEEFYFHSRTCMPMTRQEGLSSADSDDDDSDPWYQAKLCRSLAATAGLKQDDRDFIVRWNMFVRGIHIWGCDALLPERLKAFFKDHAKSHQRCCHDFLMMLWDNSMITSATVASLLGCIESHVTRGPMHTSSHSVV